MLHLKAIQKITPMDVCVSGTIDQKTYLKKIKGASAPLAPLDLPMLLFSLARQWHPQFFHSRISTVHRHMFEQLRNYSQAHLTLKKKVVACRKNLIISKPNTCLSPTHVSSTVTNGMKSTRKHPKFRQLPLLVVCTDPKRDEGVRMVFWGVSPPPHPLSFIFYKNLITCAKGIVFSYFFLLICRLNVNTTE